MPALSCNGLADERLGASIAPAVVTVDVVNTSSNNAPASSPSSLKEDGSEGILQSQGESTASKQSDGKLNRFLVLLLHANGVPEHVFQDLAR